MSGLAVTRNIGQAIRFSSEGLPDLYLVVESLGNHSVLCAVWRQRENAPYAKPEIRSDGTLQLGREIAVTYTRPRSFALRHRGEARFRIVAPPDVLISRLTRDEMDVGPR